MPTAQIIAVVAVVATSAAAAKNDFKPTHLLVLLLSLQGKRK